ncbi:Rv1535 family protein [Mycobacterium colombiense]
MTAVRYDDVVPAPLAPAPRRTPPARPQAPAGSGNPLMDMTAQLLSIPLHQLYAALWRMGVIEVRG